MKIIYALVIALTTSYCSITKNIGTDVNDKHSCRIASKRESFQFGMYDIIRAYTGTYLKHPKTVRDLIIFIERMDENMQMIRYPQYKYLKKYEANLIIATDTTATNSAPCEGTTTIYYKKIDEKHIVGSAVCEESLCENYQLARITLFDNEGYYFESDSLGQFIKNEVKIVNRNYVDFLKSEGEKPFYIGVVKYTSEGLNDLCSGKVLDKDNIPFFIDLYECLSHIAIKNNISQIYVPSYLPVDR